MTERIENADIQDLCISKCRWTGAKRKKWVVHEKMRLGKFILRLGKNIF
jgi:hypothetical protein